MGAVVTPLVFRATLGGGCFWPTLTIWIIDGMTIGQWKEVHNCVRGETLYLATVYPQTYTITYTVKDPESSATETPTNS